MLHIYPLGKDSLFYSTGNLVSKHLLEDVAPQCELFTSSRRETSEVNLMLDCQASKHSSSGAFPRLFSFVEYILPQGIYATKLRNTRWPPFVISGRQWDISHHHPRLL